MKSIILMSVMVILMACASKNPEERPAVTKQLSFVLINSGANTIEDAVITVADWQKHAKAAPELLSGQLKAVSNGHEAATQVIDLDGDKRTDAVIVCLEALPKGESQVTFESGQSSIASRAHAEISVKDGGMWKDRVYHGGEFKAVNKLRVPPEHTDHSFYIRYEGPGWESDKVGYRFYLDWRNATDIFGKTKNELALHQVGLDGFDSYHEMSDWGMDILKVGDALGIGALGCWADSKVLRMSQTDSVSCQIPHDGPVMAEVETQYYGWVTPSGKSDVLSELQIEAGSRMTRHTVTTSKRIDGLCTGIVKHDDTEVLSDVDDNGWCYLATWGQQSLANDNLGMAVFFRKSDLDRLEEDVVNHVVVFNSSDKNQIEYYFAACWQQEENGITTYDEFEKYLEESQARLNNPVKWKAKNQ